jgi:hypothetical protein
LLRRQPKIDPARVEIARSITMARLSSLFDPDSVEDGTPDEAAASAAELAPDEAVEAVQTVEAVASAEAVASTEAVDPEAVVELETIEPAAAVDGTPLPETAFAAFAAADLEPDASRNGHESTDPVEAVNPAGATDDEPAQDDVAATSPTAEPEPYAPTERQAPTNGYTQDPRTDPFGWDLPVAATDPASHADPIESPISAEDETVGIQPDTGSSESSSPEALPKRPRTAPRPSPRSRPMAPRVPAASVVSGPVAVIASCPYCALLLEPPPTADRRCTRCRQRIIVRRAHGRAVYLTEAAVQVFESERRRVANTGRWTRDRERWLKLAGSVQAPAARIARLERAVLSDEVVASARALYETTVERLIRSARRDRRWDDVARLRRDQALALHRAEGSPIPPLDGIAALHREGALAALRGIGEIAKEAALVGIDCCDHCRADVGRQFRISAELREPRLPHRDCPAGLCKCHWELTPRDRDIIGGYLRRHARPDRVAPSA